jgi:hypothetical protein
VGCVAVLGVVVVKGWTTARTLRTLVPTRYETAFGTLAGSSVQEGVIQDLRRVLRVDPSRPPRLFSHSTDAWIYLALPADNPTRFALLRPGYNSPEQIQESIDRLDADREAAVLVNLLSVKPGDPVIAYLRASWPPPIGIGPPVILGAPLYQLFRRQSAE